MTNGPDARSEGRQPEPRRGGGAEEPVAPSLLRGRNVVCFSTADWDTLLPTNKHQLMRRLAAGGSRVLYLETLGTRAPKLSSGVDAARVLRRLQRAVQGPRRRTEGLWTLSPAVRPVWQSLTQITLNRWLFRLQTARALSRFPRPVAWIYNPYAVYLLEQLRPALVVYHLVDDLAAVPGADAESIREAEGQLLARADVVFCTEQSLYDRAKLIARDRAYFMPNVADYAHFSRNRDVGERSATRLAQVRALPRPRLLFSGNLAPHKVDLDLLLALARLRPGWHLVLVGPLWEGARPPKSLAALERQSNVTFTGHVEYDDLPAFLHEADVLLIPYVLNDATKAVFPLKFFEYLATGRPVVASPLPSLLPWQALVPSATGAAEWVAAIEEALAHPGRHTDQRRALARRHTWERRLAEMEAAIAKRLR